MKARTRLGALALVAVLLAACGGGGGDGPSTPISPPGAGDPPDAPLTDLPTSDAEAARFLTQTTFGATKADIAHLREVGYSRWIDEQMNPTSAPVTLALPYLQELVSGGMPANDIYGQYRRNYWLWRAATSRDQLRMRMAFALSEIMVISDRDNTSLQTQRAADYQDTLARGAFGSYRTLLKNVTLHPAMGNFLSYVANRKATDDGSLVPDENYAREVMQLFTIGLVERNLDFTPILDAQGNTKPTYNQDVISAMARVFTGWTYAGLEDNEYWRWVEDSYAPMECHPKFHDDQPKRIFRNIVIDEGNDCVASLEKVLDALTTHPNTAPFVSRQLIQRFVTSNPSPAYVRRVATVWGESNGDLGKVLRAILLDSEARTLPAATNPTFGKAREPLIKLATIWRVFNAKYAPPANGNYLFNFSYAWDLSVPIGQDSLHSPSVFNFFEPDYMLPGQDGATGYYAPEFQIINEASFAAAHNQHDAMIWDFSEGGTPTEPTNAPILDLSGLTTLAENNDHVGMVQDINLLLYSGALSQSTADTMVDMLDKLLEKDVTPFERARSLVLLAFASPEFAVQR